MIVPVIRQAEDKSFLGIARAIVDLAERAGRKKLKPEEVASSTFTITNPGIFGEQFGTPVINQPESAIMGVGGLFKEATVVTDENGSDSLAIRSIIRLTLGFDHRIIDGADAGRFMAEVKKYLGKLERRHRLIQNSHQRRVRDRCPCSHQRTWAPCIGPATETRGFSSPVR